MREKQPSFPSSFSSFVTWFIRDFYHDKTKIEGTDKLMITKLGSGPTFQNIRDKYLKK